jgi:hypothetical protein
LGRDPTVLKDNKKEIEALAVATLEKATGITKDRMVALRNEARRTGNFALVNLCKSALKGDKLAWERCVILGPLVPIV